MADLVLSTTDSGRNLIVRSLYGDSITFTRIAIGNGTPADTTDFSEVSALANEILSISLTASEPESDYIKLTGQTTSASINSGFYGYEVGVYAEDGNGVESLFAYMYSTDDADYYPSSDSGRALELTLSVVVQLGNAENVSATLVEGDTYATKTEFDEHVDDTANPHSVTKAQVGLGNVPNVTTNNQTPTYTVASGLAALVSGEVLSTAMGKIAKAVSSLISHLSNTSNPHSVTYSQVGAAASSHNHAASAITSGTLGVARGGTGQTSLKALRNAAGLGNTTGALPVANGGSGLTSAPSLLVNLASTSATDIFTASPRPGVTGTLPVARGGTGNTSVDTTPTASSTKMCTSGGIKTAIDACVKKTNFSYNSSTQTLTITTT